MGVPPAGGGGGSDGGLRSLLSPPGAGAGADGGAAAAATPERLAALLQFVFELPGVDAAVKASGDVDYAALAARVQEHLHQLQPQQQQQQQPGSSGGGAGAAAPAAAAAAGEGAGGGSGSESGSLPSVPPLEDVDSGGGGSSSADDEHDDDDDDDYDDDDDDEVDDDSASDGGDADGAAADDDDVGFVQPHGRLGPRVVGVDPASVCGAFGHAGADGLVLESRGNFSSARANAAVYAGRWLYEATVLTPGIQQLGWCTLSCPFTHEEGVGDAPDSYAVDGKRVRRWCVRPQPYGEVWAAGDVIGCALDLDAGSLTFYRNGASLGLAYDRVRTLQPGLAYFPAASLSHAERCALNFGARPLSYPVPGYAPLQAPPPPGPTAAAAYLCGALGRLAVAAAELPGGGAAAALGQRGRGAAALAARGEGGSSSSGGGGGGGTGGAAEQGGSGGSGAALVKSSADDALLASGLLASGGGPSAPAAAAAAVAAAAAAAVSGLSLACSPRASSAAAGVAAAAGAAWAPPFGAPLLLPQADVLLLSAVLLQPLGALLPRRPYLAASALLPVLDGLQRLSGGDPPAPPALLSLLSSMELMWGGSKRRRSAFTAVALALLEELAMRCQVSPLLPRDFPHTASYPPLTLAVALLSHPGVMRVLTAHADFVFIVEGLMSRKAPSPRDLQALLPHVWWRGCRDATASEERLAASVSVIAATVARVEQRQYELAELLLRAPWPRSPWPVGARNPDEEEEEEDVGDDDGGGEEEGGAAAPRFCALLVFVRCLLGKNREALRDVQPPGLSEPTVLMSTFFALLRLLQPALAAAHDAGTGPLARFPAAALFAATGLQAELEPTHDAPRLGGVVGHLEREHPLTEAEHAPVAVGPPRGAAAAPRHRHRSAAAAADAAAGSGTQPPHGGSGGGSNSGGGSSSGGGSVPGLRAEWVPELLNAALLLYAWRVGANFRMLNALALNIASSSATVNELDRLAPAAAAAAAAAGGAGAGAAGSGGGSGGSSGGGSGSSGGGAAGAAAAGAAAAGAGAAAAAAGSGAATWMAGTRKIYHDELTRDVRLLTVLRVAFFSAGKQQALARLAAYAARLLAAVGAVRPGPAGEGEGEGEGGVGGSEGEGAAAGEGRVAAAAEAAAAAAGAAAAPGEQQQPQQQQQQQQQQRRRGDLLRYVPVAYADAVIDFLTTLRRCDGHGVGDVLPDESPAQAATLAGWVSGALDDRRIANPDVQELLLHVASLLLDHAGWRGVFEADARRARRFVRSLLVVFDGRLWHPASGVLLKIIKGSGFGGTAPPGPPPPRSLRGVLLAAVNAADPLGGGTSGTDAADADAAAAAADDDDDDDAFDDAAAAAMLRGFLNRTFNTLNWTLTEFTVSVGELHGLRGGLRNVLEAQNLYRRTALMFELSANFMRVLECVAPTRAFLGGAVNRARLRELVHFVLSHFTVGPDSARLNELLGANEHHHHATATGTTGGGGDAGSAAGAAGAAAGALTAAARGSPPATPVAGGGGGAGAGAAAAAAAAAAGGTPGIGTPSPPPPPPPPRPPPAAAAAAAPLEPRGVPPYASNALRWELASLNDRVRKVALLGPLVGILLAWWGAGGGTAGAAAAAERWRAEATAAATASESGDDDDGDGPAADADADADAAVAAQGRDEARALGTCFDAALAPRLMEEFVAMADAPSRFVVGLHYLVAVDWSAAFPSAPLSAQVRALHALGAGLLAAREALDEATRAAAPPFDGDDDGGGGDGAGAGGEGGGGGGGGAGGGGNAGPHEDFVDPITAEVMRDPVVLPDSGVVVDRPTIERHLLSSATDPFSRAPLAAEQLRPAADLAARIEAWRREQAARARRARARSGGGGSTSSSRAAAAAAAAAVPAAAEKPQADDAA